MSGTKSQEPLKRSDPPLPNRRVAIGCLCFLVIPFLFFLGLVGAISSLEPPLILAFGWIAFLGRTLPKISWNWDVIGMGLMCVALILFLAHRFLTWFVKNVAAASVSWRWPWKWTWCGLSAVMIFFLVGMATGGIAHQIGWIITSPDPWFEVKGNLNDKMEMERTYMAFRTALEETNGDLAVLRRRIWSSENNLIVLPDKGVSLMEKFHILFIVGADKKVTGLIIFLRDPQKRAKVYALYSNGDSEGYVAPNGISDLIRTNQQNLISF